MPEVFAPSHGKCIDDYNSNNNKKRTNKEISPRAMKVKKIYSSIYYRKNTVPFFTRDKNDLQYLS